MYLYNNVKTVPSINLAISRIIFVSGHDKKLIKKYFVRTLSETVELHEFLISISFLKMVHVKQCISAFSFVLIRI